MAYPPCSRKLVPLSSANSPRTLGMLLHLQLSPIWEQEALAVQQGERHYHYHYHWEDSINFLGIWSQIRIVDHFPLSSPLQNGLFSHLLAFLIPAAFMKLGKMTSAYKGMNPLHSGSDLADTHIQISPEIRIQIPDHFWLRQPRCQVRRRRRFWRATHDCVAPYVDIILHRGRF